MNLGDQDPEEAAATPDTVCEVPKKNQVLLHQAGSVLKISRVSERRLGIVALDLKFC